jgi:FkbM family methyltransferase
MEQTRDAERETYHKDTGTVQISHLNEYKALLTSLIYMNPLFRIRKAYNNYTFNLSASENRLYLAFYRHFYRPRKGSLSDFIDNYSRKHSPVTFLQVGANDGFIYDPLHKFIKRDNWRGVMLEPQPDVFNEYLVKLHMKRPEILMVNAALDKTDGTTTLYKYTVSLERWATGMASFNRQVLEDKIKDGTILKKALKQGVKLPDNKDDWIVGQEIATISPETLMGKFGNEGFKLLAIDTEGFDYEILKMLDLNRISPEVIIYEEVNLNADTARECRSYLQEYGYSCRSIEKDVLATRP